MLASATQRLLSMTGRGKGGTPAPPHLPPRDLTLTTRPVPRERHFDVRSVGPGAAPDITDTVEPLPDLKDRAGPFSARERCGDAMYLLDKLDGLRDPTWASMSLPPHILKQQWIALSRRHRNWLR